MKTRSNIGFMFLLAVGISAQAAEIKVLSGNGARAAVSELGSQFERASGHKLTIRFEVNPEVKRKIEAGESFDVAILNPPVLDDLIKQGKIAGDTRSVLGRSGIGVAVRGGAPKPDISSVADFGRAWGPASRADSAGVANLDRIHRRSSQCCQGTGGGTCDAQILHRSGRCASPQGGGRRAVCGVTRAIGA